MDLKKEQFINDINIGELVDSTFIVSQKQVKKKKNGEDYCTATFQDRSGTVEGVLWTEVYLATKDFSEGDLVKVKGVLKEYRGAKQLIVDELARVQVDEETDLSDYIKSTRKDIEGMFSEVLEFIQSLENKHLKQLLRLFMSNKEFVNGYKTSTAAVRYHHAFQGGLLEHSLNVTKICDRMTDIYDNLNRDLLIAGAILHDVGKIKEYSSGVNLKMTNTGRLLGHITIGYGWVMEKIKEIKGFPSDLSDRLLHIILSHHGHLEYGSPKRPKIMEAFIVYHSDHLDGDIGGFNIILENTSDENDWSEYVRNFARPVYVRQLDLTEENDRDEDRASGTRKPPRQDGRPSAIDRDQDGLF